MSDASPELSPADEAALAAFADGRLDATERAELQARIDADPELAAALGRQRAALSLIVGAAEETSAPMALRARIEALQAKPRRSWLGRMRERMPSLSVAALGTAAAAAAVIIAVVVSGGAPAIDDVLDAAARSPAAAIAPFPAQSKLLREQVEGVTFPNYLGKFGWKATGTRTDEIGGRTVRTIFYEKDGDEIAYSIVSGEALPEPEDARREEVEGTVLRVLGSEGRTVVTWRRQGHTCVLSSTDVPAKELLALAAWKGMGDVKF